MDTPTLASAGDEVEGAAGALDVLRAAIHLGELVPGDRLPSERELAARFGVGRMTLRRALAVLQQEGYLVARRGAAGGTFVTSLDEAAARWRQRMREDLPAVEDLHEFRTAVETHVARLAARRRTDEHLARMQASLDGLGDVADRAHFRQLDNDFHRALTDAAGSARLEASVAACRAELFGMTDDLDWDELIATLRDEHGAVLAAVASGDADAAARAMEQHLASSRATLMQILAVET